MSWKAADLRLGTESEERFERLDRGLHDLVTSCFLSAGGTLVDQICR